MAKKTDVYELIISARQDPSSRYAGLAQSFDILEAAKHIKGRGQEVEKALEKLRTEGGTDSVRSKYRQAKRNAKGQYAGYAPEDYQNVQDADQLVAQQYYEMVRNHARQINAAKRKFASQTRVASPGEFYNSWEEARKEQSRRTAPSARLDEAIAREQTQERAKSARELASAEKQLNAINMRNIREGQAQAARRSRVDMAIEREQARERAQDQRTNARELRRAEREMVRNARDRLTIARRDFMMATAGIGAGLMAGMYVARGLGGMIGGYSELGGSIMNIRDLTGASARQATGAAFLARAGGMDPDRMATLIEGLQKAMFQPQSQAGLGRLGIAPNIGARGTAMFDQVIERLSQLRSSTYRTMVATEIFGQEGAQSILPLLRMTSEQRKEVRALSQEFGTSDLQNIQQFGVDLALTKLKFQLKVLIPLAQAGMTAASGLMVALGPGLTAVGAVMNTTFGKGLTVIAGLAATFGTAAWSALRLVGVMKELRLAVAALRSLGIVEAGLSAIGGLGGIGLASRLGTFGTRYEAYKLAGGAIANPQSMGALKQMGDIVTGGVGTFAAMQGMKAAVKAGLWGLAIAAIIGAGYLIYQHYAGGKKEEDADKFSGAVDRFSGAVSMMQDAFNDLRGRNVPGGLNEIDIPVLQRANALGAIG